MVYQAGLFLFLLIGWSAPFLGFILRRADLPESFVYLTKGLYFLFGFVFFLFIISFIRDTLWMVIDLIRRAPVEEMKIRPCCKR